MSKRSRQMVALSCIFMIACSLFLSSHLIAHASAGTFQQYTYNGSAGSRPYYVYTPANYQVGTTIPLVVMLHGCTQNPTDFAAGP